MSSTKASNAVLAIARSKYGKRITEAQLKALCSAKNIEEIVEYLKSNTEIGYWIEKSGITEWHRASLEAVLQKKELFEIYSLCGFEKKIGSPVFSIYIMRREADEIVKFIRFLIAGNPEKYAYTVLPYANELTQIDLIKLSAVRSKEGLLDFLCDYELYKPAVQSMRKFQNYDGVSDMAVIETQIEKLIYMRSVDILKKNFSGFELNELLALYRMEIEVTDIETVYRSRFIFNNTVELTSSFSVGEGSLLTPLQMKKLICAENTEEFKEIIKSTKYGKYLNEDKITDFDFIRKALLKNAVHRLHFSSCPAAVTLAYIITLGIERKNLTHIIEGVRYGVDAEKIANSLNLLNETEVV